MPDLMVVRGTTDSVYRLVSDHLGSVRLVVNASSGYVAQSLKYDAWGNVTEDTNPGFTPFGYAGGIYDGATALVRFGARDYEPATGRWTSKDPVGFANTVNLAAYAENEPINTVDIDGEAPRDVVRGVVQGAGAAALGTGAVVVAAAVLPAAAAVAVSTALATVGVVSTAAAVAEIIQLSSGGRCEEDLANRDELVGRLLGGALFGGAVAGGLKGLAVAGPKLMGDKWGPFMGRGIGGQALRIGLSRTGGNSTFRIGGEIVPSAINNGHIYIHNYGPL